MPVTLHPVDRGACDMDAQARTDLVRIYADAPAERLPSAPDAFIEAHLDSGGNFLCARFNDRLIGAIALRDDGEAWWLSHFCVRKPTRRRGVGSRLLTLVAQAASAEGKPLRVEVAQLQMADQLMLSRLGYRLDRSGDHYELALSGRHSKELPR
ncbi:MULTISPECIES: acetyl-CoA sensor PanZ family protein [Halomonas]|uniref:Acetyl-CoA sensor PanZ family protein n=2 Tax=Halomonas TaxID=2745 RepID=A0A7X4W0Y8_9GAMM|nr:MULTISPECIES: acetyl-CoA sensor PanZ family protein [Halomonas]MDR5900537.1 acetyl-CoA sensor PanZ family protein [Halomonas icarae]NAW13987.1 acetyl-CoA sensor PanZ family protein [Halomonas icarae]TDB02084.1 GNAT family N-acetyltransferase [Halomonas marinisediminis]